MSRLDAIAVYFGGDTNKAKNFARAVREEFEAAPSYAEILVAIRHCPAKTPSAQQVVAQIKRARVERDSRRELAEKKGRVEARPNHYKTHVNARRPQARQRRGRG